MRVLIVKISSLGDIIHTLPAVTDAHRAHKDLVFDWVVEENFVEVPAWHPAVDKVIPVAIRRWRRNLVKTYLNREFRAFKRALQGEHYDLVIDAQGLIKSGIISRLSKGLTIGLSNHTIREPPAALFYNKVYSVTRSEHAVDRVRQLFSRALNYRYDREVIDYGVDIERIAGDSTPDNGKQLVFYCTVQPGKPNTGPNTIGAGSHTLQQPAVIGCCYPGEMLTRSGVRSSLPKIIVR